MTQFLAKQLSWAFIALLIAFHGALSAQPQGDWSCGEDEKFAPAGKIITLGQRSFRLCAGDFSSDGEGGWVSLAIEDEKRIDDHFAITQPNVRYRGSIRHHIYEAGRPYGVEYEELTTIHVDDVIYAVRVQSYEAERARQEYANGEIPNSAIYYAAPVQGTPEHYLDCNRRPVAPFVDDLFCRLKVIYRPGEDLYINQIFTSSPDFDPDFGNAEFGLQNLPSHVRTVHEAFGLIDITGVEQLSE